MAAVHARWGRDFTHLLNQHSQLHCWELAYWRFRANLNNKLLSNVIVSEFVSHINEKQLLGGDVVLLSELIKYFGKSFEAFDTHKSIQHTISNIILDHVRELSLRQLEAVVTNLQRAGNNEGRELITEIKQTLSNNL